MIVRRQKNYSFFDKIKNLFSSNKSQKEIADSSATSTNKLPIKTDYITFKEAYEKDYWPALVVLGIKSDSNKADGGWTSFVNDWMKGAGFFDKGGELIGIHELSKEDNVNGKNGANMLILEFSKDTKVNSGTRLVYGNNFKWPEDVFCDYNSYYTWYKSGKELFD